MGDNKLVRDFSTVVRDYRGNEIFNPVPMDDRIFSRVIAAVDNEVKEKIVATLKSEGAHKLTLCHALLEALRFVPEDKRSTGRSAKELQDINDLMRRINKIGVLRITTDERDRLKEAARAFWGRLDPWTWGQINDLLEGGTPELSTADEVEAENVTQLRTGEGAAAT